MELTQNLLETLNVICFSVRQIYPKQSHELKPIIFLIKGFTVATFVRGLIPSSIYGRGRPRLKRAWQGFNMNGGVVACIESLLKD